MAITSVVAQEYDLKSYSEGDGLSSAVVYSITQDELGYLWLGTSYGLNKFDGQKFKQFYTNDGLLDNRVSKVNIDNEGVLWIKTGKGIQSYNGHDFSRIDSLGSNSAYFNEVNIVFESSDNIPFDFKIVDTLSYNNQLFVATYGGGLWTYDKGLWNQIDDKFLFDRSIYDLFVDKDNNFWIASNYGITLLSESEFQKAIFDYIHGAFEMIEFEDELWIGGRYGVDRISTNSIEKYILEEGANFILCMGLNNEGQLQAGGIGGLLYEWNGDEYIVKHEFDEFLRGAFVYDIETYKSQTYYACENKVLVASGDSIGVFDFGIDIGLCYDIQVDGNRLWFATSEGLVLYSSNSIKIYNSDSGMTDHSGRVVEVDDYGNVWFGTYSSGLIQFDGENFKTYGKKNGLNNELIKSIQWDVNRSSIWVGTNDGLHQLKINAQGKVVDVQMYAKPTGYPFLFCHNKSLLIRNDGSLLFSVNTDNKTHEESVYSFSSGKVLNESDSPNITIESLQVWNEDYILSNELPNWEVIIDGQEFNYKDNHLSFQFGSTHFTERHFVEYQWYLEGYEDSWRPSTHESFTTYTNLSHGTYTLNLRSKVPLSNWSTIKTYNFTITPPFWLRWWFICLAIVLLSWSSYTLITLRQKRKHKEQIKELHQLKQKAELELKALRAQFNPHFVFNVLNSIQSIILDQDDENAIIYLSDFSKLMRMTLNYSREKVIVLRDELEFLDLYISLEQLRFEQAFELCVEVDEFVDTNNFQLPPLILQPYVGNAIKHGLLSRGTGRKLDVKFNLEHEKLKCTIKDNGIGREKSEKKKNKGHNSKGLIMMQERIDYLNLAYDTSDFSHMITDVLNEKGAVCGTQVIIYIPTNL